MRCFAVAFLWSKRRTPVQSWWAEVKEWEVHVERHHYKDTWSPWMKVLVSFWVHLLHISLYSETLTSNEGFIYVTVTSLILCFATAGHFGAIKMQDLSAWIHVLLWNERKIVVSSPNTCMYTWLHTQTTHPCSSHTSLSPLCGKLLLITTQSASLVHIGFQECLKHTLPYTVKPTGNICTIELDI